MIGYSRRSSPIRILHGVESPTTPYNEQNLYNLYVKAFSTAGFNSRLKVHLPRHILGYEQEGLGYVQFLGIERVIDELSLRSVDARETAKMGWVRGETYFDVYAPGPSTPKKCVLLF